MGDDELPGYIGTLGEARFTPAGVQDQDIPVNACFPTTVSPEPSILTVTIITKNHHVYLYMLCSICAYQFFPAVGIEFTSANLAGN